MSFPHFGRLVAALATGAIPLFGLLHAGVVGATTWRGIAEMNYQAQPVAGGHDELWRQFCQISAEGRLFVRNDYKLTLRLENQSFAGRQPSQLRTRWNLDLTGTGYGFRGFYAPATVPQDSLPDVVERRYNAALTVALPGYPRATFSYDGLSRALTGDEASTRRTYTFGLSYERSPWQSDLRLLRRRQAAAGGGFEDVVESALLRNDLTGSWRRVLLSAGHRMEYTERRRTPGLASYSAVQVLVGSFSAPIKRWLSVSADYDGRFNTLSGGGQANGTNSTHILSARANYRPTSFFEAGAVRYSTRSDREGPADQQTSYSQLRAAINGRLFATVNGLFSVYRTWNSDDSAASSVNDAAYLQMAGSLFGDIRFSIENSYLDRNTGARPVDIVRSFGLRGRPLRRTELQADYASQASTDRWRLSAVDRQSINFVLQQQLTDHVRFSVGRGFNQDRSVSRSWQKRWLFTGQAAVRRLLLVSGNYNQLEFIRPVPGGPPAFDRTRRKSVDLTLYPENRWLVGVTVAEEEDVAGVRRTTWSGNVRYQF